LRREKVVGSSISGLFDARSPSAVPRRVVTIIVGEPVNRISRSWPETHIRKERLKRGLPPITYRYSPASVVSILRIFGVAASAPETVPDFIFWRPCHPMGVARSHNCREFYHEATARLRVPRFQACSCGDRPASTGTPTVPVGLMVGVTTGVPTNNGQSPEDFPGEVHIICRMEGGNARQHA